MIGFVLMLAEAQALRLISEVMELSGVLFHWEDRSYGAASIGGRGA